MDCWISTNVRTHRTRYSIPSPFGLLGHVDEESNSSPVDLASFSKRVKPSSTEVVSGHLRRVDRPFLRAQNLEKMRGALGPKISARLKLWSIANFLFWAGPPSTGLGLSTFLGYISGCHHIPQCPRKIEEVVRVVVVGFVVRGLGISMDFDVAFKPL